MKTEIDVLFYEMETNISFEEFDIYIMNLLNQHYEYQLDQDHTLTHTKNVYV